MKRKEYFALFETRTVTDPYTGKDKRTAVYIGPKYRASLGGSALKRVNRQLAVLWLLGAAAFAAAGLLNAPSSRCFYVFPFYAAYLFPLFYWGMGVFRMFRLPSPFTRVDKDAGPDRLHRSAIGCVVVAALHTVGDAVFLLLGGANGHMSTELAALCGVALCGLLAAASLVRLKAFQCEEIGKAGHGNQ